MTDPVAFGTARLDYGAAIADVYRRASTVGPLMVQLDRLKEQMLAEGAVFLFPRALLPGMTSIYGTPILRADVEAPMVAIPGAR